jgi:hypothetical protein
LLLNIKRGFPNITVESNRLGRNVRREGVGTEWDCTENNLLLQVEKFQEGKFLGTELLNSAQDVLRARQVVQALMKKCAKLAAQMERAIAAGASSVKKQPSLLSPRSIHNLTCIVTVLNYCVYGSYLVANRSMLWYAGLFLCLIT